MPMIEMTQMSPPLPLLVVMPSWYWSFLRHLLIDIGGISIVVFCIVLALDVNTSDAEKEGAIALAFLILTAMFICSLRKCVLLKQEAETIASSNSDLGVHTENSDRPVQV